MSSGYASFEFENKSILGSRCDAEKGKGMVNIVGRKCTMKADSDQFKTVMESFVKMKKSTDHTFYQNNSQRNISYCLKGNECLSSSIHSVFTKALLWFLAKLLQRSKGS